MSNNSCYLCADGKKRKQLNDREVYVKLCECLIPVALRLGYDVQHHYNDVSAAAYPIAMYNEMAVIKSELAQLRSAVTELSKLIKDEQYRRIVFDDMKKSEKVLNNKT